MTVRFGIVGCGGIARWHAGAIQSIDGASLSAVCDADEARAAAFAREYAVPCFTDMNDLLGLVDAVCVCTPSGLHAQQAEQALLAGKHALVEKPLAITRESLARVLQAQKTSGALLCAVSQLRYSPDVAEAKRLIESGALGRILLADLSMKYWREPAYYESNAWRGTRAMDGGGALMNQGIHGVDLLRFLCGEINHIRAYQNTLLHDIETEDALSACFTLAGGGMGALTAATCAWPGHRRRLEICGSQGSLTLEEDRLIQLEIKNGPRLEKTHDSAHGASDPFNLAFDPHRRQLSAFVEAVRTGGACMPDGEDAARTLNLIFRIYEAAGGTSLRTICRGGNLPPEIN
ncbi:MAG: Gfo/Idh/MocA family oxidoreductase [Oscillospiraceae bacterium]|nr:Gfo/Idh/MocA family oxidoreductase [Oscillospiraceae bacterium]